MLMGGTRSQPRWRFGSLESRAGGWHPPEQGSGATVPPQQELPGGMQTLPALDDKPLYSSPPGFRGYT